MKYHFSVTGIGFCVGNLASHEDLIEAAVTKKLPAKQKTQPTPDAALEAALKYRDENPVLLICDTGVSQDILDLFRIACQQRIAHFGPMLQEAGRVMAQGQYENVLLLSRNEEGCAAVLLSRQPSRCFAQVEIHTQDVPPAAALMEAMMQFITAVVEIRYAFQLDGSASKDSYIWHWAQKRALERTIDGVTVNMKEAELANKAVFASKRYLFPVLFDTVGEAREKLSGLQQNAARQGLYKAMGAGIADLKVAQRAENIIVLLAEDYNSLKQQTDELLAQSQQLLTAGFRWESATGSRYIRRSTETPKVVFMNPPGGMFNSKPFYRYVSKLYDFVEGPVRFERGVFYLDTQNEMLRRYLQEINITFVVMYLLEAIGIQPDYLSGASMGEVVFNLSNCVVPNAGEAWEKAKSFLETAMRQILEGREEQEAAYFGHPVELAKYYLKCDARKAKQAMAKYEDVFVFIEGSPGDLLICGEKASCLELIRELGCIPIQMDDPTYIHTPVVESEFEKIRAGLLETGIHLDVDGLPYQLFSTYLKKNMDSTSRMFAENFAAIITRTVDYTQAVKTLYAQDARVFIDLSTTQLCGGWAKNTLSPYPDAEVVPIYEEKDTADYLLDLCAVMLAGNVKFDFDKIYSRLTFRNDGQVREVPEKIRASEAQAPVKTGKVPQKNEVKSMAKETMPQKTTTVPVAADAQPIWQQYLANQMALNQRAYELYLDAEDKLFAQLLEAQAGKKTAAAPMAVPAAQKKYLWDRQQAIEMTENSMAAVLGEQYRKVDQYPIRARMPLPPFMFVSRIVSIDAEFGVLRPSSIVSEYDLDEDCVFRMGDNQVSPLIGAEASHIGIFLLAYMGIDAMYDGKLSYRAIGSNQVTYSERPFRVGDTMRTVLRIDRFVQNGSTILIFFTFETYNGKELIAVTETTGGFFTKEELMSNKGILSPKKMLTKAEPREFPHITETTRTTYDKEQMAAFYSGKYAACFGNIPLPSLKETYYIPHDMKMIDRVTRIDYNGGMYGRGIICGEKQITPDMWPFKAHFKNDPVFPAIIMTDGVTQLGVFLFAHTGLLSKFENATVTAINGNCVASKFRGQARHGYSTLGYEVHVKEVVETAEAISVYFDAKIFNDGLQIIQVESYALKIVSAPN